MTSPEHPERPDEALERLMSRVLDGEATPAETAQVQSRLLDDPAARAAYEDYIRIDRDARDALRAALTQPAQPTPLCEPADRTIRFPRATWLAAAAGVMAAA